MGNDTDNKVMLPDAVIECLAYSSRFTTVGGNKIITGFFGGPLLLKAVTPETIERRCQAAGIHLNPEQLHRCVLRLRGVRQEKRKSRSTGFVQRYRQPRIGI